MDKNIETTPPVSIESDEPEIKEQEPEEEKEIQVPEIKKPEVKAIVPVKHKPKTKQCLEKNVVFENIEAIIYKGHGKYWGKRYAYMYRDVFKVVFSVFSNCQMSAK